MTNTQKQRYKIRNTDLEILTWELDEAVASGEYPKYDTQAGRKTYVITRELCSLPANFLKYFRRN